MQIGVITRAMLALLALQDADAPDRKALVVLQQADEATRAVQRIHCEGEFFGTGSIVDEVPKIRFEGWAEAVGLDKPYKVRVVGTARLPHDEGEQAVKVASDGETLVLVDDKLKVCRKIRLEDRNPLIQLTSTMIMPEFVLEEPFRDELNATALSLEDPQSVAGVECDVLLVQYRDPKLKARWYFARSDHLPRRVDRIIADGKGSASIEIRKLEANPTIDPKTWTLDVPQGYAVQSYPPPTTQQSKP